MHIAVYCVLLAAAGNHCWNWSCSFCMHCMAEQQGCSVYADRHRCAALLAQGSLLMRHADCYEAMC